MCFVLVVDHSRKPWEIKGTSQFAVECRWCASLLLRLLCMAFCFLSGSCNNSHDHLNSWEKVFSKSKTFFTFVGWEEWSRILPTVMEKKYLPRTPVLSKSGSFSNSLSVIMFFSLSCSTWGESKRQSLLKHHFYNLSHLPHILRGREREWVWCKRATLCLFWVVLCSLISLMEISNNY